jgi:hypothetical protein
MRVPDWNYEPTVSEQITQGKSVIPEAPVVIAGTVTTPYFTKVKATSQDAQEQKFKKINCQY